MARKKNLILQGELKIFLNHSVKLGKLLAANHTTNIWDTEICRWNSRNNMLKFLTLELALKAV